MGFNSGFKGLINIDLCCRTPLREMATCAKI